MLLIATPSADILARCSAGLQAVSTLLTVANHESLCQAIVKLLPDILLLDIALPGFNGAKSVTDLCRLSPFTKIIVLGSGLSDETELTLFNAGVRGFCESSTDSQQLRNIFTAVRQGQIWIRRSLMSRLLDARNAHPIPETQSRDNIAEALARLTPREYEIAVLISNGNTNKQVARHLSITERTVKAHLSEIFRKLGINDRLMLALRVIALRETAPVHAKAPVNTYFPVLKIVN
jgi:DNA-binding NarL/FixJ family response regulator